MKSAVPNHYATLGLDRRCTGDQIRTAYRLLAKQHHPDLHPCSPEAVARTQALNAAYETLDDPDRRKAHDLDLDAATNAKSRTSAGRIERNVSRDVMLRLEDFLNGTTLEVRVNDPANPNGAECYELVIPPGMTPGARFRLPRDEPFSGGFVMVRARARPSLRFKVRGADVRCDLRIKPERATQGGSEMIQGITGQMIRVHIPARAKRGEIIRIPGEGLPRPRGGRGDLLVRVTYRTEIRITRKSGP